MYEITGKVAVVTGGASGIGLSVGKALLADGLKGLVIADIDDANGAKALQSIWEEHGGNRAIFVKLDVTDRNQFEDAFKRTVSEFGNVDILVNSAGICSEQQWEKTVATNLTGTITGTVLAIEQFLPNFKTGSEGIVLNVSSIYGIRNYSCAPIYTATKHAVVGLTKSFGSQIHYDRTKVRVMAVCPGYTDTPLFSQKYFPLLSKVYLDIRKMEFPNLYKQGLNSVSQAMIHAIRHGKNGSLWVVEDDHHYEFIPTTEQQAK